MNEQRFANVDAYAACVVMRAANSAMVLGSADVAAHVQPAFENMVREDNLSAKRAEAVAAKLHEIGYRW